MPTDIAVCRECASTNISIRWDPYHSSWQYNCRNCGHHTPERPTLSASAEDVDWRPADEVKAR